MPGLPRRPAYEYPGAPQGADACTGPAVGSAAAHASASAQMNGDFKMIFGCGGMPLGGSDAQCIVSRSTALVPQSSDVRLPWSRASGCNRAVRGAPPGPGRGGREHDLVELGG